MSGRRDEGAVLPLVLNWSWATRAYPDLWLIILGGLFILVVLFLPGDQFLAGVGAQSIHGRVRVSYGRR